MSQVLTALDRESNEENLSFNDKCALKYHNEHQNDTKYLLKLEEAMEILKRPSMSQIQSRSPNDQRQTSPDIPLNRYNPENQSKCIFGHANNNVQSNRSAKNQSNDMDSDKVTVAGPGEMDNNRGAIIPVVNASGRPTRKCAPKNLFEPKLNTKLQSN